MGSAATARSPCSIATVRHGATPKIVQEVIEDAGFALADAIADGTAAFGAIVGVDLDFIDIALVGSSAGDGIDLMRQGMMLADPGDAKAGPLGGDTADGIEQFGRRFDADNRLVQLARRGVKSVEAFDLTLAGLCFGNIGGGAEQANRLAVLVAGHLAEAVNVAD